MKKIPITNVSSVWSSGAFVMNLPVQEFGWLSWRDHPAGGFRRTRQTLWAVVVLLCSLYVN